MPHDSGLSDNGFRDNPPRLSANMKRQAHINMPFSVTWENHVHDGKTKDRGFIFRDKRANRNSPTTQALSV